MLRAEAMIRTQQLIIGPISPKEIETAIPFSRLCFAPVQSILNPFSTHVCVDLSGFSFMTHNTIHAGLGRVKSERIWVGSQGPVENYKRINHLNSIWESAFFDRMKQHSVQVVPTLSKRNVQKTFLIQAYTIKFKPLKLNQCVWLHSTIVSYKFETAVRLTTKDA